MKPLIEQFLEGKYSNPGNFEATMFKLYGIADLKNRAKLKQAFPHYFGELTEEDSRLLGSEVNAVKESQSSAGQITTSLSPGFIEKTISYDSLVRFTGRNGDFKQKGLALELEENVITFQPITSKEEIGRCSQQIPLDHVPQVIRALQELQGYSVSQPKQ